MEEEYKRLLKEIKDAYFLVQDRRIALVSTGLLALYGYSEDEWVGKPITQIVAPEEQERILELHRRRLAGEDIPQRYETIVLAKDGTRIPIEVSVWLTHYGGRRGVAGIVTDVRERQRHQAEVLRAQEEERWRIARELHDSTIQELVLVSHHLHDVAAGIYGRLPVPARERVAEVQAQLGQTIDDIRNFTQNLRPSILDDMGLLPALRWLTDRLAAEDGLHLEVRVLGKERRLSPEAELGLFRIAQEALSNVRRHAHASTAVVTVEFGKQSVTMSVSDDGSGFEPPPTADHLVSQGKLGLRGIGERARLLHGNHRIESAPGKGATVRVEIAA